MKCQFNRQLEDLADAVADRTISEPLGIRQLNDGLARCLGTDVQVFAQRLPDTCMSVWTGLDQADHIGYNPTATLPEAESIVHAAGHLLLGHCGQVRDGGQFACVVAGDIGADVREQVRAVLPDRETTPQRVFSSLEEHQAEAFAGLLLNRFGYDKSAPALACIG